MNDMIVTNLESNEVDESGFIQDIEVAHELALQEDAEREQNKED